MRFIAAVLVFLAILAGFYAYAFSENGNVRMFEPGAGQGGGLPAFQAIAAAAVMLVGMLFGVVSEKLKDRTRSRSVLKELQMAARSPALFRALLASPIVYAAIYVAAQKQPDAVISLIFAFQNGFFCQAILRERGESA